MRRNSSFARADLVFRCYLRACEATADDLALAHDLGQDPADPIRRFVEAELTLDRPAQAVLSDIDYLPEPQRSLIREHQGRNVVALQGLIADEIANLVALGILRRSEGHGAVADRNLEKRES